MALTLALTGVLFALTPRIARPTVPLGVSVPRAHCRDDVVRRANGRFVTGVLVASVVSLGLLAASARPSLEGEKCWKRTSGCR